MGSRRLPLLAFPVIITRVVKTIELSHLVCAQRPGVACVHSPGYLHTFPWLIKAAQSSGQQFDPIAFSRDVAQLL